MASQNLSPEEAAAALSEVAERQRQVAELAEPLQRGHLAVLITLSVLLFARMDLPHGPGSTAVGYLLVILLPVVAWVMSRRRRVSPHPSLYGWRGWLVFGGVAVTILVLGSAAGELIQSWGVPLPYTLTGVVMGVLCGAGGLLLNRWLRRIMVSRTRNATP
jgi:uncharacterized membrane protein